MRTSLLILALLLAGAALPLWWSPYSASAGLALAIETSDTAVVARTVDLQRLQRIIAHHARTSRSLQRNLTLDPAYRQAFETLAADLINEEVARRTQPAAVLGLIRRALGPDSQGTRFMRARQLLERRALEWRDLSSVYVGSPDQVRLVMVRSGLMWRVVGLQFPDPRLKLELVQHTPVSEQ
jgi:hypothetical protein